MSVIDVFEELILRAERSEPQWHVASDDMDRWTDGSGMSVGTLLDRVAIEVARQYDCGALSFEIADDVVNVLHSHCVLEGVRPSDLFGRVFDAFDEGEYHHTADRSDDPEIAYTQPMIRAILAAEQASRG